MPLDFRKITSDNQVSEYLAEIIGAKLMSGEKVLWLVSGGSAIKIATKTAENLKNAPLENLIVTLIDERWGPVGHKDSNWHQLEQAGFSLPGAVLMPVLNGKNRKTTADNFAILLQSYLGEVYSISLLGIGPDGHTSGILPGSSAVNAEGLTHDYEGGGYQRVTTTAKALSLLDEAVVYAVGEAKKPVLQQLEQDVSPAEQPAQFLKRIKKVTIFNDYKGEPA